MRLSEDERYTCFAARLYEEDLSDAEVCKRFEDMRKDKIISRYCVFKHFKDGAKTHFHVLALCPQLRPSKLYSLGFKESDLSDVKNRKSMYFYIKEHRGISDEKKRDDEEHNHRIETIYDDVNYKNAPKTSQSASLSGFIDSIEEILREVPHISKIGLLRKLQSINEAYLGYYLRYYRFVEEIFGKALFELPGNSYIDLNDDD